ncbi:sialate O-acetylesterase [Pseudocnuella soli]|uniref:sialate O-acetylesterase n=1 Tax=Pseudocnuella soli TaxID=2502779 RepID=UPI001048FB3E|nr:sialate O-acetylesterase [Pseudocnuella soli]
MRIKAVALSGLLLCALTSVAQVKLPRLVRDSMVLQRSQPLKIWGWASPGEKVQVKFGNKTYRAVTGHDKKWQVVLPPQKAGGPHNMTISGTNRITLKDILIGDVWLCAGQSNMVHQMELHKGEYPAEYAGANNPQIRQFWVPNRSVLTGPEDDLPAGNWKWAGRENIGQFSVVAYFFAKNIWEQHKVPIGIINASVGGTPVEAWTSEEGLKALPKWAALVQQNKDTAYVNGRNRQADVANAPLQQRGRQDKGMLASPKWFEPAYQPKGWQRIHLPGFWEDAGLRNLDGVVWYRKEIEVPQSMTGTAGMLYLGRIVDADAAYINGKLVGQTGYQYPQRRYTVPADLLKPGKNVITVRITNSSGKGGFVPDKPYSLSVGGQELDLTGYWQYKVGEVFTQFRSVPGISIQNSPTALYNAMVAPLTPYAIKGVLWYQGESNAGNPAEYAQLMPAFVADWRSKWRRADLPFVLVQLPNFMEYDYLPAESGWAQMREAQEATAKLPNTGLVVTIDLGAWNDIHPGGKGTIGNRAALVARNLVYGESLVYSGPRFAAADNRGDSLVIRFDHTGSGLVTKDGGAPGGFAIAGRDKKFVWADARIEGNSVVLWNSKVPQPQYVRYAWADNPHLANLYNKEGLPAAPFRTDKEGAGNAPATH